MKPLLQSSDRLASLLERRSNAYYSAKTLYWHTLHGFILSGRQVFEPLCFLVGDDRGRIRYRKRMPGPYPLAARTLARSLLELVANVLCVVEDPEKRALELARDGYRERYRAMLAIKDMFGGVPRWQRWLADERKSLLSHARRLRLSDVERDDPQTHILSWPGLEGMLQGRKKVPFLSAERLGVLTKLRDSRYAELSRVAHQKDAALRLAFAAHRASSEDFVALRNDSVWGAALFFLCILTEIELAREMEQTAGPRAELRKAWLSLEPAGDEVREVYRMRYAAVLS
jgi:hypothetical protein